MKRYKDYMDNLEVSDTLHEKLKNSEEPKKKSQPWARYGAAAAALALIVGAGAWGLSRSQGGWGALMENFRPNGDWNDLVDHFSPAIEAVPEIADIPRPDIAIEDPNGPFVDPIPPGARTDGGYEVVHGDKDDPNTMVSYYLLPYLEWADASALPQNSMDYTLAPPDAIQRDATWDDVRIFAGGEKAMSDHLLWDEGMNWSGTLWFAEDGTPCAAALHTGYVNWGYGFCLSLEVMQGGKVPSCVVLPKEYYETSQWQDVKITTLKNGGYMVDDDGIVLTEKREVSFFCNGTGYKLTLYAHDADRADELCARFVRYAVDGGFHLYALSYEPIYEEDMPKEDGGVPEADSAGFDPNCPYCADGAVHTHPYDPGTHN